MCMFMGTDFDVNLDSQIRLSKVCGSSALEKHLNWIGLRRF